MHKKTDYKKKLNEIVDFRSKITYLRSIVINDLIFCLAETFIEKEVNILNGTFDKPLLEYLDKAIRTELKAIIDSSITNVYQSNTVLKIELAGFKVIPFLLNTFIKAQLTENDYEGKRHALGLLPNQYKSQSSDYEKILNVTMFVTSMTDRYAVELYKNLNGIELAAY